MANAGRVAIVPKGDWSAAVEYKRLDAVAYNNTLYVAKKAVPAGTVTTNTEYWMKCVVGGAGAIATEADAGIVKAGEDIGVDSTGEMSLKTDFTEQTDLAVLTGNEDRQTFFGKIAKAVSTLISHIGLSATADKAGHVKLSGSTAVTDSTGLALPVTEKNASLSGTLANQIDALNKSLASRYFGIRVKNTIIQAFTVLVTFSGGEGTANLADIYLSDCNTDDYYLTITFNNLEINGIPVYLTYKSGTTNTQIVFQMPYNTTYAGQKWVLGIAVATHK